jgi:hypothetical protein
MKRDAKDLRTYIDAYGVAVRAGVLTPSKADEESMRKLFGLPPMDEAVSADWDKSGGVRKPITLAKEDSGSTDAEGVEP